MQDKSITASLADNPGRISPDGEPATYAGVICIGCASPAPRTSKFCGQCGTRLWEPCLKCKALNSISERFCNGCGGDLAAELARLQNASENALRTAGLLAEQGKLLDAIGTLESLVLGEHSQLDKTRVQIAERVEQYRSQRDRVVAQASDVLQRVKQFLDEVRYADALAEAAKIPPALRNAELSDLHNVAAARVKQSQRLREQLQASIADKKFEGLLPVAVQLSELLPHDPGIQKLVAQLDTWQAKHDNRQAEKLVAASNEALAANAYQKADALLSKVRRTDNAGLQESYLGAKERVWLAKHLATAPYVTSNSATAASRLVKLQPGDSSVKNAVALMQKRWTAAQSRHDAVPATWTKPPAECLVARDVEVCPLPKPLVEACVSQKKTPHDFVVAYGLALQAAGLATVPLRLIPDKSSGWREKLKIGIKKRKETSAWGIDLGGDALTAIRVESSSEPGTAPVINEVIGVEYQDRVDSGTPARDGQISESVKQAIASISENYDLAHSNVTVSMSGPQTLGRFFEMPLPSPSKFQQAVEYEMKARVPLPGDDIVYDFHADELPSEGEVSRRWVTLVAATRKQLVNRLEAFHSLACAQVQACSSSVALLNTSLSFDGVAENRDALTSGVAIVDIGGSSTNIVVVTPNAIWFRGFYFGGDRMVGSIAKQLKIDRATATKYYRRADAAPLLHCVEEALVPTYSELAEQIARSLEQCKNESGQNVDRVLVTGSDWQSLGLLRFLRIGE